jgi:hypothetical protein
MSSSPIHTIATTIPTTTTTTYNNDDTLLTSFASLSLQQPSTSFDHMRFARSTGAMHASNTQPSSSAISTTSTTALSNNNNNQNNTYVLNNGNPNNYVTQSCNKRRSMKGMYCATVLQTCITSDTHTHWVRPIARTCLHSVRAAIITHSTDDIAVCATGSRRAQVSNLLRAVG